LTWADPRKGPPGKGFWHCRARNVGFAVVARSNAQVHAAISRVRFDDDR
jgi:hypothetical protein